MEKLKKNIGDKQKNEMEFLQAANRSKTVLSSIKLTIIDLIHKLMEIEPAAEPVDSEINENTSNGVLLEVKK